MLVWGWRIPFLAALPIVVVALVLRARMSESSLFLGAKEHPIRVEEDVEQVAQEAKQLKLARGYDSSGPTAASSLSKAHDASHTKARARCAAVIEHAPVAQLLRHRALPLLLDMLFVGWLSSCLYVVYAWIPAALRKAKVMSTLMSLGMAMSSLAAEFIGIVLGGWVAPRMPNLIVCAVSAPVVSFFVLGTLGAMDYRSVPGVWIMHNTALGLAGFVLGLHAASFVHIYDVRMRSTGFSLAYNAGCALGGTAPAIVTALSIATTASVAVQRLIPAVWLLCLSVPAAAGALWLLKLAPSVNRCGRTPRASK